MLAHKDDVRQWRTLTSRGEGVPSRIAVRAHAVCTAPLGFDALNDTRDFFLSGNSRFQFREAVYAAVAFSEDMLARPAQAQALP